ncbi:cysteine desulfurase family protein [Listeria aquatica]|uniref:cysteine desulfurase family protein n=1 Tax=Listeria aquatica TaxID=1494960 RepID=UPI003F71E5E3
MKKTIYLDHAATSPIHPNASQVMLDVMTNEYGNPSSIHAAGRSARKKLDEARQFFAEEIGAEEREIVFTSGGTESDNTAIIGAALANATNGRHIITSKIEHHAVLRAMEYLEKKGFQVTYLPVNSNGQIELQAFKEALTDDTILVSIMYGNNEMGALQPIAKIGELLENHQALFHTDAVQAFGLIPLHVSKLGVDLLSVSAHKINGPRGVGFLYVKEGTKLEFPFHGGEQERKRRAGTENLAGIAGFKEALAIMRAERIAKAELYRDFKQNMAAIFQKNGLAFEINGLDEETLPHVFSVRFFGVQIEQLLMNLDMEGIEASSGSACTAGSVDPSHVLVAMFGEDHPGITETLRISFGLGNDQAEIMQAAETISQVVLRLAKRKEERV